MEKVTTFISKNSTWFSWGTMVTLLAAAMWLIQAMNGLSNTINILNTKFDNFNQQYATRAVYIDGRLTDHEVRIRELEKI